MDSVYDSRSKYYKILNKTSGKRHYASGGVFETHLGTSLEHRSNNFCTMISPMHYGKILLFFILNLLLMDEWVWNVQIFISCTWWVFTISQNRKLCHKLHWARMWILNLNVWFIHNYRYFGLNCNAAPGHLWRPWIYSVGEPHAKYFWDTDIRMRPCSIRLSFI